MKKRIDDIEILRAAAIIFVVIEHMHLNLFIWGTPALNMFFQYFGGWTGVDLFLVISGYVIAKDLVPQLQESESRETFFSRAVIFWTRRFWRLVPSAWTWLAVILLAAVFFNRSGAWGTISNNVESAIAGFLHVANFHVALLYGKEFPGATFVFWSLSLEEQFYLLLPFLVLVSGRKLPFVLGLLVVAQIFLERDTPLLALVRTDGLFLGVLIALWSRLPSYPLFKPVFLRHPGVAVIVIPAMLGMLACVGSTGLFVTVFRYGLVTCIAGFLVWAASYDEDYFARPRWLKVPLLWVGTRSYALYLTHLPSYFLTREIWFRLEPTGTRFNTDYTYQFLATALIVLVCLSELNYRLIESPARKHGVRIAGEMERRGTAHRID